jgi:chondroitin AC lyase
MESNGDAPEDEIEIPIIKGRLRETLLPTDPNDIAAQIPLAREWIKTLRPDGSWSDINYRDQTPGPWETGFHLFRVLVMSRLYHTPDQPLYRLATLPERIRIALDFWFDNDFQNPNWWHNIIGVPRLVGASMLLMEADITPEQLAHGLDIVRRSSLNFATGANRTWVATNQLIRGCLERSSAVVTAALSSAYSVITLAEPGAEGIQPDFSFHQHEAVLYSGGYGMAFTIDAVTFVFCAAGTSFALPSAQLDVLIRLVLDGQQWMLRGDLFDYSVVGREITRVGKDGRPMIAAVRRLAEVPDLSEARRQALRAVASRMSGDSTAPPLIGNRHFWHSDYMTHQRQGYFASVRMLSTRVFNTDSFINNEGRQTAHLADGAMLLYRTGEEYRDIFPIWDWRRVPGITCEQRPEPLDISGLHVRGETSFVGGVSDGMFGLAAMDFRRGDLSAKKVWLFCEAEIVCLGAGITCSTENPVLTSVEQRFRSGAVTIASRRFRSTVTTSGERTVHRCLWAQHDTVGYLFPDTARVTFRYAPQTGRWIDIGAGSPDPITNDVFSVWMNHGEQIVDAGYYYLVLPGIEARDMESYAANPQVEMLSNTEALQAARHNALQLCGAAFYAPGTLSGGPGWTITTNQACLLLLQELPDSVRIAVSNPENRVLTVTIEIDRALTGTGATAQGEGRTRIVFALPGDADAGSSVVRTFRRS